MIETIKQLKGDFVVLDLGSAHSVGILRKMPSVMEAITLIEIDLHSNAAESPTDYFKRIKLKKAVAGKRGKRVFKQRKFPDCSSFLDPRPELIRAYGLEDYFVEMASIEIECEPITELLLQEGVKRVDLLKTDLEGLDYEVLASDRELVSQALCVQSELRFQPFFQGERMFHEVLSYLTSLGFELIWMRPAVWKYATAHRALQRDGRWVWADVVLFLNPKTVESRFGHEAWKAFVKQIIVARLLGLANYSQYLYQQTATQFPTGVREELARFVQPAFSLPRLILAQINKLPFGWMAIGAVRSLFRYGYKTTAIYSDDVMTSSDLL
jgi:FkbM family methyltransferase